VDEGGVNGSVKNSAMRLLSDMFANPVRNSAMRLLMGMFAKPVVRSRATGTPSASIALHREQQLPLLRNAEGWSPRWLF